jgi:Ser/Thr protein kinase RdoA (MazF antagonist)
MLTQTAFPVTYSTLACEALQDHILPLYPIESVLSCQFWNRGLSDVYLVETLDARYVLRVSHAHWRNHSEIEFELSFLRFLWENNIPVAAPLSTESGELFVEIPAPEGSRYAALFPYAPGEIPIGDLNEVQGRVFGETIARIHQVAAEFHSYADRQPLTLTYLLDESLAVIEPYVRHHSADWNELLALAENIRSQLAALPQKWPYWTVCWGDAHSGNVHFTPDNHLMLFDFDQCGYGWRAFELAKFLQVSLRTGMARRVREAVLQGYQDVQTLTQQELDTLQLFTQTAHLWNLRICLEASRIHSCSRLDDQFFKQRLQQLKMLKTQEWQLF